MINQLQLNDMVKLSQHAINSFYGQDEHVSFYIIGGMNKVEDVGIVKALETGAFVDYVSEIISFDNGNNAGLVESFYTEEKKDDACVVKYFDMIDLSWKRSRHKLSNLYKVSTEDNAIEN